MMSALVFLATLASLLPTCWAARAAGGGATELTEEIDKKFGDPCDCYEYSGYTTEEREKNNCCGAGLICSKSAKKCKPAVGADCQRRDWWKLEFGTNCAVSTYGRYNGISCQKVHDGEEHKCCVGNYGGEPPNSYQYAPVNGDDSTCCSGYAEYVKWLFPSDQKYNRRLCKSKSSSIFR
mmetsp:Transcript_28758/g.40433  ORF Transcript_28758/g.40433 Transcript_28758/m.40433 type:complete len:179 (-) Transcript_28758:50-586(-)